MCRRRKLKLTKKQERQSENTSVKMDEIFWGGGCAQSPTVKPVSFKDLADELEYWGSGQTKSNVK